MRLVARLQRVSTFVLHHLNSTFHVSIMYRTSWDSIITSFITSFSSLVIDLNTSQWILVVRLGRMDISRYSQEYYWWHQILRFVAHVAHVVSHVTTWGFLWRPIYFSKGRLKSFPYMLTADLTHIISKEQYSFCTIYRPEENVSTLKDGRHNYPIKVWDKS